MKHRVWGLLACVFVLGLGGLGVAGCGSEGASEVAPGDSDVVTPDERTNPEEKGGDEVLPEAPAVEDCAAAGDEDADGAADCLDADCSADPACAAPPPASAEGDCADGLDEDADGDLDCADSDCTADPVCSLPPPAVAEDCTTAADEDGDGQGQCTDTDCAGDPACSGGGGSWEIDPSVFDKFKAVEPFPWPGPGPGPECLSCPYEFGIEKEFEVQGYGI
jgi:hypothetical protein